MNKILTLYNIEFKRIYKLYFTLIGLLFIGNFAVVWIELANVISNVSLASEMNPNMSLLKHSMARDEISHGGIYFISDLSTFILAFSVILCLMYAIVIWYRDFLGKSRTSYTLFMLPINRFNIYISKLLTIVMMIYGITTFHIIANIAGIGIISKLSGLSFKTLLGDMFKLSGLIQSHQVDFIFINIVGVVLAVVVIFTGVMIQRAFNKKGIIFGALYIVLSIVGFLYVTITEDFSDRILIFHSIYYMVLFILSITISYKLINNKVYL